ncbi:TAXI family TRAP transporter solute-binding subunit [Halomonas sp. BM-2019]|uniref:TAXI family TRAP transporter solute-binding subunit n=1 Tax=Halomonas sp. BM-2019 TaxID=2811227 RepID=UPI001B3C3080|nr:MAG: TAXI family TRAP transporter solute-binding subunit [Halomonas sp. BM-2019]
MSTQPYSPRRLVPVVLSTLLTALLLALPRQALAEPSPLVISTASPTGVYHITGQVLCRLVAQPCRARPSDGSVDNLRALRDGEVSIALAQSDLQYHAVHGREGFAEAGPDEELRALFSIHSEPFTLVARNNAGIEAFDDLAGRAVNIGNPGSGQRGTMLQLMAARGWTHGDFALVNELPADQQSLELCHGNIDAMVYTVGHPDTSIRQAVDLCDAVLVDVEGPYVDALLEDAPYFSRATIPAGLYYVLRRPAGDHHLRGAGHPGGHRGHRPGRGLRRGSRGVRQFRALHRPSPGLVGARTRGDDPRRALRAAPRGCPALLPGARLDRGRSPGGDRRG